MCVLILPNLYPLGTPCMINHVQRGRLWVNESHVIGFHVLDVDKELRERLKYCISCLQKDAKLRSAEETDGTGLVSKVYTVNKVNVINTHYLWHDFSILCVSSHGSSVHCDVKFDWRKIMKTTQYLYDMPCDIHSTKTIIFIWTLPFYLISQIFSDKFTN